MAIKTILFVDDDTGARLLIKKNLEVHGYQVVVAENGVEAMAILDKRMVDLVITDIVMPEMDGVDLYQALKASSRTANLPIIIITEQEVFIESFTALGVEHFIAKSAPTAVFLKMINDIEKKGQKGGALYKVIVGAVGRGVAEQMAAILREKGCLVSAATSSPEIISKSFLMVPDVIFIDLSLKDHITVRELIRALRSFDFLRKARIVIFSNFSVDQGSGSVNVVDGLASEIEVALQAGATKYIGRFSRVNFAEQLESLGII